MKNVINNTLCHVKLSTIEENLYDDIYSDDIEIDIDFLDGPLKGLSITKIIDKAKLRNIISENKYKLKTKNVLTKGVIMPNINYRNENTHMEEYSLVEAKHRFRHFCNHCGHFNKQTHDCALKYRVKKIIITEKTSMNMWVRKIGGCGGFNNVAVLINKAKKR